MAAVHSIVTRGFGPSGSIALVVTAGYTAGAAIVVEVIDLELSLNIQRTATVVARVHRTAALTTAIQRTIPKDGALS